MFNCGVKLWLLHTCRNGSLRGKFPAQEAPLETNLICREHLVEQQLVREKGSYYLCLQAVCAQGISEGKGKGQEVAHGDGSRDTAQGSGCALGEACPGEGQGFEEVISPS